jgi:hypothetical protein
LLSFAFAEAELATTRATLETTLSEATDKLKSLEKNKEQAQEDLMNNEW